MVLSTVNPLFAFPRAAASMYQQTDQRAPMQPYYFQHQQTEYSNRGQANAAFQTSFRDDSGISQPFYPALEANACQRSGVYPYVQQQQSNSPFSPSPCPAPVEPYQAQSMDTARVVKDEGNEMPCAVQQTTAVSPTAMAMKDSGDYNQQAAPKLVPPIASYSTCQLFPGQGMDNRNGSYYYGVGAQSYYGLTAPNTLYFPGPSSVQPGVPSGTDRYGEGSQSIHFSQEYPWMKERAQTHLPYVPNMATSSTAMEIPWCTGLNQGRTRTRDKYRMVYTESQRFELEKEFITSEYISTQRKAYLSRALGLSERQIKIWFQNRRAKKRKQSRRASAASEGNATVTQSQSNPSLHETPAFRSLPSFSSVRTNEDGDASIYDVSPPDAFI